MKCESQTKTSAAITIIIGPGKRSRSEVPRKYAAQGIASSPDTETSLKATLGSRSMHSGMMITAATTIAARASRWVKSDQP